MKRHLHCAKQQVSRSNLTKYCACHAERLTYVVLIAYETSFTVRGATDVTSQPRQILRLSRRKTHILSPHHIWNVIYSAPSNRCHDPTSPNTAPATKNESYAWSSLHMKPHFKCAEQQVSLSNLTKYCACHAERLTYVVLIAYETSFTLRGATDVTSQPRQILRLSRSKTHILSPHHIWNVIYSAPSNRCHDPTSPNTAPATKNECSSLHMKPHFQCAEQQVSLSNLTKYCACHEKWHCKISEKICKNRWNVISNAGTIRAWSDHENENRNPPRKWGYFSSSPGAFSIVKHNVSSPILHSNIHQVLRLPQKVTLDLHQILPLPRKVTLEPHMKRHLQCAEQQMSRSNLTKYCACHEKWVLCLILVTYETSFPIRGATGVTIQPHQILRLPRKMTLQDLRKNLQKQVKRHFQCGDDPSMIRAWSDHENQNRNPPRKWGYFSSSPEAFSIVKYNVSSPILHSNIHQVLRLPQKVTLDLHQILPLPRKVTLELHQILPLPRKVTLELHQILPLPRKMSPMLDPRYIWNLISNARSNRCHYPTSPNTAPATQKRLTYVVLIAYETSFTLRGATDVTSQPRQILRLSRSKTHILSPHHIWNVIYSAPSNRCHDPTSPNTAPATKNECSSLHMKPHFQCAEQQVSLSNLTKYCACHEKWHCKISEKICQKQVKRHFQCGDDPSMIRPWKRKPQPASQVRLLFELPRSIFYCKTQRFEPNLTFKHSPSAAPATKSNTWPSPNTAPTTKSNTWTTYETSFTVRRATDVTIQPHQILRLPRKMSPMLDPRYIWNLISNSRSNRCHYPTSPNTAPAAKNDTARSQKKSAKTGETSFPMRGRSEHDPSMIRPWKPKPQPASQVRLLFELPRSIFYCKIQRFEPNLTFKHSPSAAPATKSNTWPSPNTAPTTKSNTWTSPNTAPTTKSNTWTSPSTAPATKSDTWPSPSTAPATKSDSWTSPTLLLYLTLLYLLYLTLLYLTLLYLILLYLTYSTWLYSTWHYSTWLYSTWLYSTWPTLLDTTLLYLTLFYLTLLYLTLLGCRSYIGSFSSKLPLTNK